MAAVHLIGDVGIGHPNRIYLIGRHHTSEPFAFRKQIAHLGTQVGMVWCRDDQLSAVLQYSVEFSQGKELIAEVFYAFLANKNVRRGIGQGNTVHYVRSFAFKTGRLEIFRK